jgi:hypothetical protein
MVSNTAVELVGFIDSFLDAFKVGHVARLSKDRMACDSLS